MATPTHSLHPDLAMYVRQPHESSNAFHAFQHYRNMPPVQRSLERAWQEHQQQCLERLNLTGLPGSWGKWAREWSWRARASAYDDEQDRVEVAVAQARTETWAAARIEFRESWRVDMRRLYSKLIRRVEEMLAYPITEAVVEEELEEGKDGEIHVHREVHMPAKWRWSDTVRMINVGQMLALTIAETPNDTPSEDEALRAWAEREGIPYDKAKDEYEKAKRELGAG